MKNLKNKYPIFTFGEETQKEIIALIEEEIKEAQSEMMEDLIIKILQFCGLKKAHKIEAKELIMYLNKIK